MWERGGKKEREADVLKRPGIGPVNYISFSRVVVQVAWKKKKK